MSYKEMDGQLLKKIFAVSATKYFDKNVEYINSLNVFPVPDGDTGTNMNLTVEAGLKAISLLEQTHLGDIMRPLSKGMLLGARGNSGVILSQIWRGMSQSLEKLEQATTKDFALALKSGSEVAYHSVMKPVEGTILTVVREMAEAAMLIAQEERDLTVFFEKIVAAGKSSLARTPDLLPILKEVGVVDSGGQGLVTLFEGMQFALQGVAPEDMKTHEVVLKSFDFEDEHGDDEFGYCTEFIIKLDEPDNFDQAKVSAQLQEVGNSLVLVHDEEILKVHVHTLQPLQIFDQYGSLGEFIWIKAENMQTQVDEQKNVDELLAVNTSKKTQKAHPQKKVDIALLSVVAGQGLSNIFQDLGVHRIIDGGQTSNPSTEDILNAIDSIEADAYIVLPNNSNIILAAEQVKTLTDKKVEIVPSKTIPQGLAATIAFNPTNDFTRNVADMSQALSNVTSGEITTAVRDTSLNGVDIKSGSFLAISEKEVVASEQTLALAAKKLLDKMITADSEIITLIEGEGVDPEIKKAINLYLGRNYPQLEIDYIEGNQSVYFYLIAVE
jgi:hypothetical protein